MKTNDISIEDLYQYLPHMVECSYINTSTDRRINAYLTGLSTIEGIETTYRKKKNGCSGDYISLYNPKFKDNLKSLEFKLHLREISEIIKEIDNNSEKFIPIVKLAQMEFDFINYEILPTEKTIVGDIFKIKFEHNSDEYEFYYMANINIFMFSDLTTMTSYSPALKNTKMVNKLLEWKFDINNLIKENKAINLNSLVTTKFMKNENK